MGYYWRPNFLASSFQNLEKKNRNLVDISHFSLNLILKNDMNKILEGKSNIVSFQNKYLFQSRINQSGLFC